MTWWKNIELKGREKVDVTRLSFDIDNPRFTPEKRPDGNSDAAIISKMISTSDLGELFQSISSSGYIDIEPLVVIGRGDELVVLEGNRRLAALKTLSDPNMAKKVDCRIPDMSAKIKATLNEVAVYRVDDEADARDLIGFKHINGPKPWDSYAKGRYAAKWLDIENAKKCSGNESLSLSDIAHRMGDKHSTIYRIVDAVYVLDQSQEKGIYDIGDRVRKNFSFSHLYTALSYTEYREFLGMPAANRELDPERNMIPDANLDKLRTVLLWLYGSKSEEIEPVIAKQNPDVARLKRVLGDPKARRIMLERNSLDEAEESTVSAKDRFEKSLVDADENLRLAQSSIHGYDGKDQALLEIGDDALTKARTINKFMKSAFEDRNADSSGKN